MVLRGLEPPSHEPESYASAGPPHPKISKNNVVDEVQLLVPCPHGVSVAAARIKN
jgi:hypothetical protein